MSAQVSELLVVGVIITIICVLILPIAHFLYSGDARIEKSIAPLLIRTCSMYDNLEEAMPALLCIYFDNFPQPRAKFLNEEAIKWRNQAEFAARLHIRSILQRYANEQQNSP